jgi:predicted O-methyltransferase YrrM
MLALKCKTLFGIDPKEEKDAFLRKVLRFDPDSVVVNIAEKTIKFSLEHSTLREVFELINQVYVQNQYDVSKENVAGKTVVDVGANIGDFSMLCAVLGAKKVYAFEPDEKYFEILKNAIRENGFENIIIPINKKLGWLNKYEIIKLDSFLNGEEVDFIKIDVEGNEANVLIGATNIIRKFKPTLSFSAYHNPSDKEVLPKIVRDIESKYEITLNSYAEEDFYCEARR